MKKLLCIENLFLILLVCAIAYEVYDAFSVGTKVSMYSNAVSPNIVLSGADDVTIPTEDETVANMTNEERYDYYLNQINLVAHAGGGIDNKKYANAKESLELAYKNGYRIFEVDIYMTKDEQFVLTHDATAVNKTYQEFMNNKIYNLYTPMDLADLIEFMRTHEYAYIIPDVKQYNDKELLLRVYSELFSYARYDYNITNRIVGLFKRADVLEFVTGVLNFDIKGLLYRDTKNQEKVIDTPLKLLSYIQRNDINTIIFSNTQYTVSLANIVNNKSANVIVYTIDKEYLVEQYLYKGATAIMTNFILPK